MLKPPKLGGAEQLRLFVDDLPRGVVLEVLGVSDRTLRRYLEPGAEPPAAALHALYWLTRWGDAEVCSRYAFENQVLRGLVRCHAGQLQALARRPAVNAASWRPVLALVS